ncbi:putative secreted protein [Candidatus Phytoplasma luffae]|uniref:Secreted protein n=2 Tax=Loofah witches'-broom phytoplasma TaxID=35773 RepID=A0A975IMI8_LOWBP|nr:putative secreted protein [Candidatus Phytoplasma luffae]
MLKKNIKFYFWIFWVLFIFSFFLCINVIFAQTDSDFSTLSQNRIITDQNIYVQMPTSTNSRTNDGNVSPSQNRIITDQNIYVQMPTSTNSRTNDGNVSPSQNRIITDQNIYVQMPTSTNKETKKFASNNNSRPIIKNSFDIVSTLNAFITCNGNDLNVFKRETTIDDLINKMKEFDNFIEAYQQQMLLNYHFLLISFMHKYHTQIQKYLIEKEKEFNGFLTSKFSHLNSSILYNEQNLESFQKQWNLLWDFQTNFNQIINDKTSSCELIELPSNQYLYDFLDLNDCAEIKRFGEEHSTVKNQQKILAQMSDHLKNIIIKLKQNDEKLKELNIIKTDLKNLNLLNNLILCVEQNINQNIKTQFQQELNNINQNQNIQQEHTNTKIQLKKELETKYNQIIDEFVKQKDKIYNSYKEMVSEKYFQELLKCFYFENKHKDKNSEEYKKIIKPLIDKNILIDVQMKQIDEYINFDLIKNNISEICKLLTTAQGSYEEKKVIFQEKWKKKIEEYDKKISEHENTFDNWIQEDHNQGEIFNKLDGLNIKSQDKIYEAIITEIKTNNKGLLNELLKIINKNSEENEIKINNEIRDTINNLKTFNNLLNEAPNNDIVTLKSKIEQNIQALESENNFQSKQIQSLLNELLKIINKNSEENEIKINNEIREKLQTFRESNYLLFENLNEKSNNDIVELKNQIGQNIKILEGNFELINQEINNFIVGENKQKEDKRSELIKNFSQMYQNKIDENKQKFYETYLLDIQNKFQNKMKRKRININKGNFFDEFIPVPDRILYEFSESLLILKQECIEKCVTNVNFLKQRIKKLFQEQFKTKKSEPELEQIIFE